MSIIGSRNYTLLIGAAILLNSGLAQAGYITGYEWDFANDFSSTTTNVTDSQGNVAWQYRAGAWNTAPSGASNAMTWNAGSWEDVNTNPAGKIGEGWLASGTPGGANQCPILIWKSNVTAPVDISIGLSSTSGNYAVTIFKNDTALVSKNPDTPGYMLTGYTYSLNHYLVSAGDVIAVQISPWGANNTVTTDFTVTLVPEPATLAVLGAGLMLMVGRRRRR